MRCRAVAVRGVLALLVGPLFSWSPPGPLAAGTNETSGTMAGQVVDPAGKPAAGATVWLVGGPYDEDAKTLDKTTTDAQGRFVFLQARSKSVERGARRPHLVARDAQGRLGGEPGPWAWVSMQYTPRHDLRIKLAEVQDYHGRLVDTAGKPIAGATIRPQSVFPEPLDAPGHRGVELPPELAADLRTETGADGTFTLHRVPAGGSIVSRATAPGFGSPRVAWNLNTPITLRLDRAGSIRGALVAPGGATGLDALKLSLYMGTDPEKAKDAGFRVYGSANTRPGKDGRFQFDDVPPGSGRLFTGLSGSSLPYYTKEPIPIVVKPGEATPVEVKLLPAVAVRGQVVDAASGKGIAGVAVSVNKVLDQGLATSWRTTTTDAEGRFLAYTEPGKIMVYAAEAPEGYVVPSRRGESFKMDAAKDVTWPVINLEPAARLEAIVVDGSGKPVPDAEVQFLVPRGGLDVGIQRTDREGRCSVGGLNAKEFLALRARTETAVSDVLQIRPADAKGPVRLVVSPAKVFAIRGACVDAAGRPIRQAKVTIYTSWMLGPSGLGFAVASCETDAEGRFEARPLWPGFQYHVSAAADGYDKFESKPFRSSQPGGVYDAGRLTLVATDGFVEGSVADSSGRPIAGARVFNSGDAPKVLSTQTDAAGRFRLEGFRMGPLFVFAEKAGYRFTGVRAEAQSTGVKIGLLRGDEPVPPWKPQRPPLSFAEAQKAVRRLLEKLWATPPHGRKSWTIEYMARIDPQQALKWSAELGGRYDDLVRKVAAERGAETDAEEVVALLAKQADQRAYYTLKSLAEHYASSDPEKALRFAEETIQRARRLDQPDRASSLAAAGALVAKLGKTEAGKKLVEEAADMAAKMGTDGRQGYVRGLVATALAPFDLSRAMSLAGAVGAKNERERALARIATVIAPKDLDKALEIVGRLDKRSTRPDMARTEIAYELVRSAGSGDPRRASWREDAMRVVEGMDTHGAAKMKAEALAWMAVAVAPRDRQLAHSLIDKSMAIYWDQAEEFRSWGNYGGRTAFAAFVVVQAKQIGYPDIGLLINRVLAMRPAGTDVWSPRGGQEAAILTAGILALVDPECARQLLLSAAPQQPAAEVAGAVMENLDLLQAWALIDLDYAVKLIESRVEAAKGNDFWTSYLIYTLDLLTTPPDRRAEVLLRRSGGRWFPGTEL